MKTLEIIICATLYAAMLGLAIWAVSGSDGKENENGKD